MGRGGRGQVVEVAGAEGAEAGAEATQGCRQGGATSPQNSKPALKVSIHYLRQLFICVRILLELDWITNIPIIYCPLVFHNRLLEVAP